MKRNKGKTSENEPTKQVSDFYLETETLVKFIYGQLTSDIMQLVANHLKKTPSDALIVMQWSKEIERDSLPMDVFLIRLQKQKLTFQSKLNKAFGRAFDHQHVPKGKKRSKRGTGNDGERG